MAFYFEIHYGFAMRKILLLPGYACHSNVWRQTVDSFSEGCEFTWIDWPLELVSAFHCIFDYSQWLLKNYELKQFDVIAGHSMGGLVAFDLLRQTDLNHVISVETFFNQTDVLFRNIATARAPENVLRSIQNVFPYKMERFSKQLQASLKGDSYLDLLRPVSHKKINLIYGSRNEQSRANVFSKLKLSEIVDLELIHLIPHSSHFPMIENAIEFNDCLKQIIECH